VTTGTWTPLAAVFESDRLDSMILWGPPGVGKTTLARLIGAGVDSGFIAISAVYAECSTAAWPGAISCGA
jgi:putative ATPase